MTKLQRIRAFLSPLNRFGGVAGRVCGPLAFAVTVIILALLLIPGSPLRPGKEYAKGDSNLVGILSPADQLRLQALRIPGAATDYPTPGTYLASNSLSFSYMAASVPNFGYGTGTHGQNQPVAIVLHVAGGSCAGMRNWFRNPASQASSHFGVCNDGAIEQYVEIEDAAYTQGVVNKPDGYVSIFGGLNPNLRAVSIELEGCGGGDNALLKDKPKQEASLRLLLSWLHDNTGIALDRTHVLGHFDIDSVNRGNDPLCEIPNFDAFVASLPAQPVPTPTPGVGSESEIANLQARVASLEASVQPALELFRNPDSPEVWMAVGGVRVDLCSALFFELEHLHWGSIHVRGYDDPFWRLTPVGSCN